VILAGRAAGGPLDGVRLDAPHDWDGMLECCDRDHYEWLPDEAGNVTWRWTAREWVVSQATQARRRNRERRPDETPQERNRRRYLEYKERRERSERFD
jgi:hypothetical protein